MFPFITNFLSTFRRKENLTSFLPLNREKFLENSSNSSLENVTITIEKEEKREILTPKEFENRMEIIYLSHLVFQDPSLLSSVSKNCEKKRSLNKESKWLGIYYQQQINNALHPKLSIRYINRIKEYGLFADEDIEKGRFILEYTGLVKPYHWKKDSHNPYCFEYPLHLFGRTPYTIDARDGGNESRYINHSRAPNLMPSVAYSEGILHLILLSRTSIKKGTELTYDYGPKYWQKREQPKED